MSSHGLPMRLPSRIAVRSGITVGTDFLAEAAAKDESRRNMSVASLTRLRALQASLEKDAAEAKRAQHALYVAEYSRLHERYGRNMDGSRKANAPAATAINEAAATEASAPSAVGGDNAAASLQADPVPTEASSTATAAPPVAEL